MLRLLRLLPAGLSALLLAAHFLRRGDLPLLAISLALVALLFVRRSWAARAVQAALVLGAAEWARTLAALVPARRAAGEPWARLAVILGGAAVLALAGAALLVPREPRARPVGERSGRERDA